MGENFEEEFIMPSDKLLRDLEAINVENLNILSKDNMLRCEQINNCELNKDCFLRYSNNLDVETDNMLRDTQIRIRSNPKKRKMTQAENLPYQMKAESFSNTLDDEVFCRANENFLKENALLNENTYESDSEYDNASEYDATNFASSVDSSEDEEDVTSLGEIDYEETMLKIKAAKYWQSVQDEANPEINKGAKINLEHFAALCILIFDYLKITKRGKNVLVEFIRAILPEESVMQNITTYSKLTTIFNCKKIK